MAERWWVQNCRCKDYICVCFIGSAQNMKQKLLLGLVGKLVLIETMNWYVVNNEVILI
jgi:hypothetical protein